jgi:hypothetical protein
VDYESRAVALDRNQLGALLMADIEYLGLDRRRRGVTGITWNKLCLAAAGRWPPGEVPLPD